MTIEFCASIILSRASQSSLVPSSAHFVVVVIVIFFRPFCESSATISFAPMLFAFGQICSRRHSPRERGREGERAAAASLSSALINASNKVGTEPFFPPSSSFGNYKFEMLPAVLGRHLEDKNDFEISSFFLRAKIFQRFSVSLSPPLFVMLLNAEF